jgi:hypothetical protein
MTPINIPPEGKGAINLRGRCFVQGAYRDCLVLEASSLTKSAKVQVRGSLFITEITFQNIANISLVYDDGTILQSFGAPRATNTNSLAFIQFSHLSTDTQVEAEQ